MTTNQGLSNRRHFIHGAGLSLALPWLESTASSKSEQVQTPKRFVSIYHPDGVSMPLKEDPAHKDWSWFPIGGEKDYRFTKVLNVLEPLRSDITIYQGLSHPFARMIHGHSNADQYLTGAEIPANGEYKNSISLDQVIAQKVGSQTRQNSLVMSANEGTGAPRGTHTQSFNYEGRPIFPYTKPKQIFDHLFVKKSGDVKAELARRTSVLDVFLQSTKSIKKNLSTYDQQTLNQYLDSVRETEIKTLKAQQWLDTPMPDVKPGHLKLESTCLDSRDYIQAIYGLMYLALLNDTTRVTSFSYGREFGGGPHDHIATGIVGMRGHALTHNVKNPGGWEKLGKYNRFQAEEFGRFIQQLKDTPDANGNGSMLDNTFIMHGSASSSFHLSRNYPILSAGGKNLGFKNGRYLKYSKGHVDVGITDDKAWASKMDHEEEALGHLFVTILNRFDIETNEFAGYKGGLARV